MASSLLKAGARLLESGSECTSDSQCGPEHDGHYCDDGWCKNHNGDPGGEVSTDVLVVLGILTGVLFFIDRLVRHSIRIVGQCEVIIVERFGKYNRTLLPGIHWVWPFIEAPRVINWRYLDAKHNASHVDVVACTTDKIDIREHVIDFGRQHVITKENVQMEIDALVFFRITDPRMAVYTVQNLPDAVELLVQSCLRQIIANMTLDDTFSSREDINAQLIAEVRPDAERWGVTITRVEIFNILPPADIKAAMEYQITAERDRRSMVLQADGQREASVIRSRGEAAREVLSAEGQRAAEIKRAQGDAEATVLIAEAEAACIESIKKAITAANMRAVDYLVAVQWLNSLRTLAGGGKSSVVMLPMDVVESVKNASN